MAFLLILAATPAWSQIRSDQPLAPPLYGPASVNVDSARVASDGTNFFAVWRTNTILDPTVIGGGLLTPAGEVLTQPSNVIASGNRGTLGQPDVVFLGGNYLVVYSVGGSLMARRFSRDDGRPIESPRTLVTNRSLTAWLATNGKNVLVATGQHRFLLLAADGTPLGPERDIPNFGSGALAIASNGDRYLLAYASVGETVQPRGVFIVLDSNGNFLTTKTFTLPDAALSAVSLAAASDGHSFLLHMSTRRTLTGPLGSYTESGPAVCMVVDELGTSSAPSILDDQQTETPVATWSGNEYIAVWTHTGLYSNARDVLAKRVTAAGLPLDPAPVTIASLAGSTLSAFAAASNLRDSIVISGSYALRASAAIFRSLPQIDQEPASRRSASIAVSATEQASGSIASNGTLSLVVWRERTDKRAVVRAAFIAADGEVGPPLDLGAADLYTNTAAASNGRDFLVAYFDAGYHLVARRVSLEGALDSTPILLDSSTYSRQDALAAGWSGQAYLVMTAEYPLVTILPIAPDGTVLTPPQVIRSTPGGIGNIDNMPAVQCGASGCSVTWQEKQWLCNLSACPISKEDNNMLAFTNRAGSVLSQLPITDGNGPTAALSIPASDGRSVFVYSNGKNTFAGRVTAGGVVLDTPAVNGGVRVMTSETSFALQPVTVVNSGFYFVEPDNATTGRLYWTRIEPEPKPHVSSIINLHQSVTLPLTLGASARNTYLLYSAGENDETLMAPRLFLRTLASPDPQPGTVRRHATH